MVRVKYLLAVGLLGLVGPATSSAKESLWCQVKAELANMPATKMKPFIWSSSHAAEEHPTGPIRTSIGLIAPGDTTTRVTLDGKAVPLPTAATGPIWSGKVIDLGGRVAVAFLVEGPNDSSALPSEALVVIKPGPVVVASDVIPGEQVSYDEKPCDLGLLD